VVPNSLSLRRVAELPRSLRAYQGLHSGETILVCGCGSSLAQLMAPERTITIGVNDVGRLFDPDYLVVVNPRTQFSAGRFAFVEKSRAKAIFTQLELGVKHPNVVRFRLGQRAGTEFANPDVLPFTRNSPYPALCLAIHMGARRIGVIGVDFTPNHFFANTGRHALSAEVSQIDREYRHLYESCRRMGTEVFNLSPDSLLTAFPKISQEEFLRPAAEQQKYCGSKVFCVNYQFLSCGSVFSDGLSHAANQLGLEWKSALWDKPRLEKEIEEFSPDLVFAVHGRKFSARHGAAIKNRKSAVWLLDEPYEVDDTSRFSLNFDTTFVNDPSTIGRHRNAHYLPACFDPGAHFYLPGMERPHGVGFVGGFNAAREKLLTHLAKRGLLSYVVGGPWRDQSLLQLCLSKNIPALETARLYRQTRIVINVFRRTHHYNAAKIEATSLNPRVYEALQCGALVISEHRAEVDTLCPELPTFRTREEMEELVELYLADQELFARTRKDCIRRLASHTYAERLETVLEVTLGERKERADSRTLATVAPVRADDRAEVITKVRRAVEEAVAAPRESEELPPDIAMDWDRHGHAVTAQSDGSLLLTNAGEDGPGSELGLVSREKREEIHLEFEVRLERSSRFIAKIHLADARDQSTNSYHLMCSGGRAYLARHGHVLARITFPVEAWIPLSFSYLDGAVVVRRSGAEVARVIDSTLSNGYCFLGVKSGLAQVRDVYVKTPMGREVRRIVPRPAARISLGNDGAPTVSIITTVYDRVECLEQCLRSVKALEFLNYEHIVVADLPPDPVLERIRKVIAESGNGAKQTMFACLEKRMNNWGIAPAARGLQIARGKYVCFLSDDNGYKPNHFNRLVAMLDADPGLGFVYSSCHYDGRFILRSPVPRPGRIDLGQPLFRRELFDKYMGGTLPFAEYGWDWRMVERLMRNGVRWQHVNDDTFLFRLAKYPHLIPPSEQPGISYCIVCYRPKYARLLISDLVAKTTVPYEILVWLNLKDEEFESFLEEKRRAGARIPVIGRTPENLGMSVFPRLFAEARYEMVAQIDDDVVSVSPRIAETAQNVFRRFPNVGMLTADVWQDEYTTGARPPMNCYSTFSEEYGLHDGPIDGWFAVYRNSALSLCRHIRPSKYFCLGLAIKQHLRSVGKQALLCRRMKVFHVTDPTYVAYFGMLDSEIEKYRAIGRRDQVERYTAARNSVPPIEEMTERVQRIFASLESEPQEAAVLA
jgi:glycosyltransferase involved in cell wall biosynthesis